jgi:putative peptide zinc metalloprotease protein
MRQKATNVLQRFIVRWCLGIKMPEDPFLPQSNRFLFGMYTVTATIYRWFVVLSILWFLNKVFEPYGLKVIGQVIGLAGLFGLVVMPLWQFGKFLYIPGRMDQVKMPHVYATVSVMAALVLGILLIPLPHRVWCTVYVQPRDAYSVYAHVPGRLEWSVRPGKHVVAGEKLGQMSNLDLDQQILELTADRDAYKIQLQTLQSQRFLDPRAQAARLEVMEALSAVEEQLEDRKEDQRHMTFVSAVSGTVFAPPVRPKPPEQETKLAEWTGQLLSEKNRGAQLSPGQLFCQVGDPNDVEAVVIIDQGDVEFVEKNQPVRIKLDAYPGTTFESKIEAIAEIELEAVPRSLSQAAGGSIATRTDRTGVQHPLSTSYQASAPLDLQGERLRIGMRGRAKIYTRWRPLGMVLWRFFMETFNFQL